MNYKKLASKAASAFLFSAILVAAGVGFGNLMIWLVTNYGVWGMFILIWIVVGVSYTVLFMRQDDEPR